MLACWVVQYQTSVCCINSSPSVDRLPVITIWYIPYLYSCFTRVSKGKSLRVYNFSLVFSSKDACCKSSPNQQRLRSLVVSVKTIQQQHVYEATQANVEQVLGKRTPNTPVGIPCTAERHLTKVISKTIKNTSVPFSGSFFFAAAAFPILTKRLQTTDLQTRLCITPPSRKNGKMRPSSL